MNNPNYPAGVFVDAAGDIFIADTFNNRIREVVASTGNIKTVAGNGTVGFGGDGGLATSAELDDPFGVFVDAAGDIFIADTFNNRIREVVASTGNIKTVAGNGTEGFSGDGGLGTSAELLVPEGVFVDAAGDIFIADSGNNRIREVVASTGIIKSVAGNGTQGFSGDGGLGTSAELGDPGGVFLDGAGDIFIADSGNNRIREVVASTGIIKSVAGNGTQGFSGDGGLATNAELEGPFGVFVDGAGDIFIADSDNQRVREVSASTGDIQSVAGNGGGANGGDGGLATNAQLSLPGGVFADAAGNIFIGDSSNCDIRVVFASSGILQTAAGNEDFGFSGDGGPAIYAELSTPYGVVTDAHGNLFIADVANNRIREVVAATGFIKTVAGNGTAGLSGDGGLATSAKLNGPLGVSVDAAGDIFIADTHNSRIREVFAATGKIATVVGNGTSGLGDGGPAINAELYYPDGLFVDAAGDIFIADTNDERIREVVAATGNIKTVAGNGTAGFSGDGGLATSAELNFPFGIFVDGAGNIFIADTKNSRIREVVASTGIIKTVAGNGTAGFSGDGGQATSAGLNHPDGVWGNNRGNLLIADSSNNRIRSVSAIVTATPNCTLSAAPTAVLAGQTVMATLTCTATANDSLSGTVNWGDGSSNSTNSGTATGGSVILSFAHKYNTASNPTDSMSATVTDTTSILAGTVTPASIAITVSASTAPSCTLSAAPTSVLAGRSVMATLACTALANDSLSGTVSWGDGSSPSTSTSVASSGGSATLSFTHSYATASTPMISATVTDTTSALTGIVSPASVAITVSAPPAFLFVPVTPCRVADTRNANGAFGGPVLAAGSSRSFTIPSSACGIPSSATAYSLNVTVVPNGSLGYISMWPTGQAQPFVSTLNSLDGRIKSDAAVVPAGTGGGVSVFATDATDVILDINGYFVPAGVSGSVAFYPLTPCRVADTRNASGSLGGPSLAGGQIRSFPVLSACNIPSTAQAYSLNFTAIPQGPLGYLSVWPAGQAQPLVSTLNAPTGTVTANAAIVPAGTNGAIDAYVTNNTDMVIDINGYFAPAGPGGLSLYTLTPCRVLDTRAGGSQPFSGTLNVNVTGSGCGAPSSAQAYVFNVTVVPPSPLGYVTLWPQGATQPLVSTLNALDGSLTSNMAIVPAASGAVSAYASNPTQLILDISGYFAP